MTPASSRLPSNRSSFDNNWQTTMLYFTVLFVACTSLAAGNNLTYKRPFQSHRAPKQVIRNYEVVSPEIIYRDEYYVDRQHPQAMRVAVSSRLINFTLVLQMNEEFLPNGFISRYYDKNGREVYDMGHVNCFYQGWVEGHPEWRVTMSTCHGFQGEFGDKKDNNNYFHLEPLNTEDNSLHQLHALYLHSEYKEVHGKCGSNHAQLLNEEFNLPSFEDIRLRRQTTNNPLYVEWIVVNDFRQYNSMNRNLTRTVLRALDIANGIDNIYRNQYNIRVVLIETITWTNQDMISVVSEPRTLLDSFLEYRRQVSTTHDSAMLLTGIDLNDNTVGIAFTRAMCSDSSSVGVTQDGGRSTTSTISTAAHELGHIFNMDHDDGRTCTCNDPSRSCIMSAVSSGNNPPTVFSSCSTSDLNTGFSQFNLGRCLGNVPTMTVGDPVCGNGIREGNEICDCGSQTECSDPCCNAATCQLAAGATCSSGPCCSDTCQFRSSGTVCRSALGECDIVETCSGTSSECPFDDHKLDGTPCNSNTGYCYSGSCPSRDDQCSVAFGSTNAPLLCYTRLNDNGDQFGNCGHTSTSFIACSSSNVECGQLHCTQGDFIASVSTSVTILTSTVSGTTCRSFTTQPGVDVISPGLVQDGTRCGTDRVCLAQQCIDVGQITDLSCPVGTNGQICSGSANGICNNRGLCSCNTGFAGPTCNPIGDINECLSNNGGCQHTCTNTDSSFICSCRSGFVLATNGRDCNDINECSASNGGCSQTCTNTDGSFQCSCRSGYTLASNGRECNDINECSSDNGGCDQTCMNTDGSFQCSCRNGYTLASNNRGCNDINECSSSNGGCDQTCMNTDGSFQCSCRTGYTLASNNRGCNENNECSINNGGCTQVCTNTVGSFECECNSGYSLADDGIGCNDVNECTSNNNGCQQLCTNTVGSFMCGCMSGYVLSSDGRSCNDINECNVNNGGCNQICTNRVGSFVCECQQGYQLDSAGRTCNDINECNIQNGRCDQTCTNNDGSFACACISGFSLLSDGQTCMSDNPCNPSEANCEHFCSSNDNSTIECSCRTGYVLDDDEVSCNDINECLTNNGGCAETCTNTEGSFQCSCSAQSQLASDQLNCEGVNVTAPGSGGRGNTGAVIGGAVGGVFGAIVLLILIVIIVVVILFTKRNNKPKATRNDNLQKTNSRTPLHSTNSPTNFTDEEIGFGDSFEDVHYVQPPPTFDSLVSQPTYQPPAPSYNYVNSRKPAPQKLPTRRAPPVPAAHTTHPVIPPNKPVKPAKPMNFNGRVEAPQTKEIVPHRPPPRPPTKSTQPAGPWTTHMVSSATDKNHPPNAPPRPEVKSHPPKPSAPPRPEVKSHPPKPNAPLRPEVRKKPTHVNIEEVKPAPPLKHKPALPPPNTATKPHIEAKPVVAPRPATKPTTSSQTSKMKWPPPPPSNQSSNAPPIAPKSFIPPSKKPMVPPRK